MAGIERLMGRAIPRVMLPDFDYAMLPGDLKRAVSYEEQHGPAGAFQSEGGVATAAVRIANVPRNGNNGHGHHASKHGAAAHAKPAFGNSKASASARRPKPKLGSKPKPRTAVKARAAGSRKPAGSSRGARRR